LSDDFIGQAASKKAYDSSVLFQNSFLTQETEDNLGNLTKSKIMSEITRPEDITEFPDQIPEVVIKEMREKALTSSGIVCIDKTPDGEPDKSGRIYWIIRAFGEQLLLQIPTKDEDGKVNGTPYRAYNSETGEWIKEEPVKPTE
jgi:hypothetical protein